MKLLWLYIKWRKATYGTGTTKRGKISQRLLFSSNSNFYKYNYYKVGIVFPINRYIIVTFSYEWHSQNLLLNTEFLPKVYTFQLHNFESIYDNESMNSDIDYIYIYIYCTFGLFY